MLFAFLTGIVSLRTRGVYFIMITLAFGQMAFFTASSLAPYGGDDGLTIRTRDTILGLPLLQNPRAFYAIAFTCLLATYLACRALVAIALWPGVPRRAPRIPPAWRRSASITYRFQLVAICWHRAASAGSRDFCWRTSPISYLRPTCRGSARAISSSW